MSAAFWQLDGHVARFAVAGCEISVDVAQPSRGLLCQRKFAASTATINFLGVELGNRELPDSAKVDVFVRGRDLVATYAEHPPQQVRAQIYWRILEADEFAPGYAPSISA